MSKGPGKWQSIILSELAIRDRFPLKELLGSTYTKAQYNALYRAMRKLEIAGKVNIHRFLFGGSRRTWVCRWGVTPTGEDRKCW